MANKLLSLFLLTAIFASLALVSATDLIQITKLGDFSRVKNSTTFTVKNINSNPITLSMNSPTLQVTDSKGRYATLTLNPSSLPASLAAGSSIQVNVSMVYDVNFALVPKTYYFPAIVINSTDSTNSSITDSDNLEFSFIQSYCKYGNLGELSITRMTDEKADNANSWNWKLSDNIEITVRVANEADDDMDVVVDYGLYDVTANKFIDLDEDSIDLSINDGSSKEVTIKFQVPSNSDDINPDHTFRFYVKAYEDGNEKANCAERTAEEDVKIKQDSNSIVLTNLNLANSANCGDSLELTGKISNNGKNDQEYVMVRAYNRELGLDERKVYSDFNSGDDDSFTIPVSIPKNASDKTYQITLLTYFRYDNGNSGCSSNTNLECYDRNSLDDLEKSYNLNVKVSGCQPAVVPDNAQITASLESEAKAGNDIVIRATVRNIGNSTNAYTMLTSGIDSFATLVSIVPQTLTINSGSSQDVIITMKANSDASGDYIFNIKALSGGKIKEVAVPITISPKSSWFSGSLFSNIASNWFIWVVVLVNVILIVLIIIVAVRIAKG